MKQLYREIDSAELSEWQAYYNLEQWGDSKADIRTGIIASTIANVNRGKNTKAFSYENFILKSKLELEYEAKRKKKQPIKQMVNTLMNMVKKKRKKNGD